MSNQLKILLVSLFRKILVGSGAVWLYKLIEQGVLTEGDIERFIQVLAAAVVIAVPTFWTYIKNKLFKKKTKKEETEEIEEPVAEEETEEEEAEESTTTP